MVYARKAVDQRNPPGAVPHPRADLSRAGARRCGFNLNSARPAGTPPSIAPATSWQLSGEPPYVALTAHLDTVIAPRNKDDISVAPDGAFRGPGVSDNGAGLASLLAVARAWKYGAALPEFPRGLLLAANVGEEGEGNLLGMRQLCKFAAAGKKIEAFLVVDGAETGHITTRGLGSRRFEVVFTGPGGHSWSDFGVGNPVHALSRAVSLFSDTRPNGSPKSAINVGVIEGGSSVNAIAQSARAKVDIRSEDNQKLDELVEALEVAVERAREIENQRAAGGKGHGEAERDRLAPGGGACRNRPRYCATCAWSTPIWAFARISIHRPPTPTFRFRWASRPWRSAAAAREAARIPRKSGIARKAAIWGSNESCSRCCCFCAVKLRERRRQRAGAPRQRRFAELALVVNTIVWGATFTLVKSALGGVSAILFLALRFSLPPWSWP